ncbi:MAG: hypothetical protein Q8R76_07665 [Candidatus Omnitrophota bacterium]|nr:hypothetical protein [Candidatus Omnitrophota bacterium]
MARELPLKSFWADLGAEFTEQNGWNIPAVFTDVEAEYYAVHQLAGLLDRSSRGKVHVSGADCKDFLNHMLTNEINALKPGEGCYAALLTATGRVLCDMRVFVFDNFVILDTEPGLESKLIELLKKYIITEDVEVEDITDRYTLLSLTGPKAPRIIHALLGDDFALPNRFHFKGVVIEGEDVLAISDSCTGQNGCEFLIRKDAAGKVAHAICEKGKHSGLKPVGYQASEVLRIEAGILRYGIDMDEAVTLPETGLEVIAASETKGCYPGQEVVAKTATYGGPNKKIEALTFEREQLPGAGEKICDGSTGKEIGWVTSSAAVVTQERGFALGYIYKKKLGG